jgi:hypothetical protein
MLERIPWEQFISSGEQYWESAWQGRPLVTLWPLVDHVHRTVSPTEMLTVSGTNWKPFPPPTVTSTIVLVADGTPFTAGWPFSSTIRMGGAALLVFGILVRLSPDSARTKNPTAKMTAIPKTNRAAFDIFMSCCFLCASVRFFLHETTPDALRFSARMLRKQSQETQAQCLTRSHYLRQKKGNRTVTNADAQLNPLYQKRNR